MRKASDGLAGGWVSPPTDSVQRIHHGLAKCTSKTAADQAGGDQKTTIFVAHPRCIQSLLLEDLVRREIDGSIGYDAHKCGPYTPVQCSNAALLAVNFEYTIPGIARANIRGGKRKCRPMSTIQLFVSGTKKQEKKRAQ